VVYQTWKCMLAWQKSLNLGIVYWSSTWVASIFPHMTTVLVIDPGIQLWVISIRFMTNAYKIDHDLTISGPVFLEITRFRCTKLYWSTPTTTHCVFRTITELIKQKACMTSARFP
jgi:hypothetical protein